jgi:hypothetical protein
MTIDQRKEFFARLADAIKYDRATYRDIARDLERARDLTCKRVSWNFKTAIPQYYTKTHQLQLLLPLCLMSEHRVDVALAVERTESGYLGHTIFPLDWAYEHARLVCRPDSDWLKPAEIVAESGQELDEEAVPL